MNLNERAAACLDGEIIWLDPHDGSPKFPALWMKRTKTGVHHWNPAGTDEANGKAATPGDYNHARMLYQRVVERGEDAVLALLDNLQTLTGCDADEFPEKLLEVTAAQLTEACCEVLEGNDE